METAEPKDDAISTVRGAEATMITPLKIDVEDLPAMCKVSAGILQCYAEAASVMFDQFHDNSPVNGSVALNGDVRDAEFSWKPSTIAEKTSHANEIDATEDGACAVSFAAVRQAAGYVVRKRAHHGSGSDWLMTRKGEPDNDFVRLEVSGVAKNISGATKDALSGRLARKVSQLGKGDLNRPGIAIVVGFEGATVVMREVKR